jgi:16S rRNA U516 pseudouridylate synthase RsuA-like enzyme
MTNDGDIVNKDITRPQQSRKRIYSNSKQIITDRFIDKMSNGILF